jgi:glycosyltransferase involved in cell wall biosynthesis
VRVLLDYRPALRSRSGVGEYTHWLVAALLRECSATASRAPLDLTIFSSSWTDRLEREPDLEGARVIDCRVPVSALNFAWHRLEWPSAERLTGRAFDVCHSMHPLLLPTRRAAQVITIYDLHFLAHPRRTRAEIRRDYPPLARRHAHRADHIVVISKFTAREVEQRLEVPADRITVCYPGAPDWAPRDREPPDGYVLFFGTLEPRKNIGALLDAYERLLTHPSLEGRPAPDLVLAGAATEAAHPWLERIARPPLAGRVRHLGYVEPGSRRAVYAGACLLVQPSFEEGFGMTVVEAMVTGVPVVAANRGALPEVVGDAGLLVNPDDPADIAEGLARMVGDGALAAACRERGARRARQFQWADTARGVYRAYGLASERRSRKERT